VGPGSFALTLQRVQVELIRVRIPLLRVFTSARDTVVDKEALLVRVRIGDVDGWGECVAQAAPTYLPETIDSARLSLRDHLVPRLFAGASYDEVRGNATAKAALEAALLDARLRADGISLATHLGATATAIPAGVAVGLQPDLGQLRELVAMYVAQGYRRIKCKIEPGCDVNVAAAASEAAGPDVAIAVDANGSYLPSDRGALRDLDALALQCIEQPFAPHATAEHAALARELRTPICLDESITSAAAARDAFARDAADAVSIKPGRVGGLAEALRIHDACVAAGRPALAGGMIETGVGRAALVALAALPGFTMTGDCSASDRYFADDLTEPFVLENGALRVPKGPGIGVTVRPEQLARYTIASERLTPADS
jgi:O-succinylbenzoate synthase